MSKPSPELPSVPQPEQISGPPPPEKSTPAREFTGRQFEKLMVELTPKEEGSTPTPLVEGIRTIHPQLSKEGHQLAVKLYQRLKSEIPSHDYIGFLQQLREIREDLIHIKREVAKATAGKKATLEALRDRHRFYDLILSEVEAIHLLKEIGKTADPSTQYRLILELSRQQVAAGLAPDLPFALSENVDKLRHGAELAGDQTLMITAEKTGVAVALAERKLKAMELADSSPSPWAGVVHYLANQENLPVAYSAWNAAAVIIGIENTIRAALKDRLQSQGLSFSEPLLNQAMEIALHQVLPSLQATAWETSAHSQLSSAEREIVTLRDGTQIAFLPQQTIQPNETIKQYLHRICGVVEINGKRQIANESVINLTITIAEQLNKRLAEATPAQIQEALEATTAEAGNKIFTKIAKQFSPQNIMLLLNKDKLASLPRETASALQSATSKIISRLSAGTEQKKEALQMTAQETLSAKEVKIRQLIHKVAALDRHSFNELAHKAVEAAAQKFQLTKNEVKAVQRLLTMENFFRTLRLSRVAMSLASPFILIHTEQHPPVDQWEEFNSLWDIDFGGLLHLPHYAEELLDSIHNAGHHFEFLNPIDDYVHHLAQEVGQHFDAALAGSPDEIAVSRHLIAQAALPSDQIGHLDSALNQAEHQQEGKVGPTLTEAPTDSHHAAKAVIEPTPSEGHTPSQPPPQTPPPGYEPMTPQQLKEYKQALEKGRLVTKELAAGGITPEATSGIHQLTPETPSHDLEKPPQPPTAETENQLPFHLKKVETLDGMSLVIDRDEIKIFPQQGRSICTYSSLATGINLVGGEISLEQLESELDFFNQLERQPIGTEVIVDGVKLTHTNIDISDNPVQAIVDYYQGVLESGGIATLVIKTMPNYPAHMGAVVGIEIEGDMVKLIVTDGNMGWSASHAPGQGFPYLKEVGESEYGTPYITYNVTHEKFLKYFMPWRTIEIRPLEEEK